MALKNDFLSQKSPVLRAHFKRMSGDLLLYILDHNSSIHRPRELQLIFFERFRLEESNISTISAALNSPSYKAFYVWLSFIWYVVFGALFRKKSSVMIKHVNNVTDFVY